MAISGAAALLFFVLVVFVLFAFHFLGYPFLSDDFYNLNRLIVL